MVRVPVVSPAAMPGAMVPLLVSVLPLRFKMPLPLMVPALVRLPE